MLPENVIDFTRAIFPDCEESIFEVTPLEKGGSGRMYYRIRAGELSMIFAKYDGHRAENLHFVEIARFLESCEISVPKIYHHDATEGLIWMQDLGEQDLWTFRDSDWSVRFSLYSSALRQAARLHVQATRELPHAGLNLQMEFDEELYLWEQQYFIEHGLQGVFGFDQKETEYFSHSPILKGLAQRLAALPRCLVHRDFQSQNVLIHEAGAWLIDFQGMRPGLPQYDLASLLYDPYVEFTDQEREDLVEVYKVTAKAEGATIAPDFDEIFLGCAVQRLMQALGAYGFLGLKCGRPAFLRHVPAARRSLVSVLQQLEGLEPCVELLDAARENNI